MFVVSSLYLLISLLSFIDLGYLSRQGNQLLLGISVITCLSSFFLIIAILVLKLLRKVKK